MRACECCLYVCMPRTPSSGNTTSRRNNPFRCHPCQKKKQYPSCEMKNFRSQAFLSLSPPSALGASPRAPRESFVKVERSPLPVIPASGGAALPTLVSCQLLKEYPRLITVVGIKREDCILRIITICGIHFESLEIPG